MVTKKSQKIYVDADSCPIKQEIVEIATEYDVDVVFVASYAHMGIDRVGKWVFVDCEKEEVDLYLVNHLQKSGIVVKRRDQVNFKTLTVSSFVRP